MKFIKQLTLAILLLCPMAGWGQTGETAHQPAPVVPKTPAAVPPDSFSNLAQVLQASTLATVYADSISKISLEIVRLSLLMLDNPEDEGLKQQVSDMQIQAKKLQEWYQQALEAMQSPASGSEDGRIYLYKSERKNIEAGKDTAAHKVTIQLDGDALTIHKTHPETGEKVKVMTTDFFQVDLGMNAFLATGAGGGLTSRIAGESLRMGKSIYVGLNIFQQAVNISQNKWYFSYGLAVDYYNFMLENSTLRSATESESTGYALVHGGTEIDGRDPRKSKLAAQYLTVPVKLHFETKPHRTGQSFHIAAGLRNSMLIRSYHVQKSPRGKARTYDRFYLNDFQVSPMVEVGWGWLNIFAQMQMTPMWETGRMRPQMHAVSAGFVINRLDW